MVMNEQMNRAIPIYYVENHLANSQQYQPRNSEGPVLVMKD